MKISTFFVYIITGIGMWVAATKFQYLVEPVKLFYYCIAPMLFMVLLVAAKQIKLANKNSDAIIGNKLSKAKYFSSLVIMQLLFYMVTFWLFSCYIYQTNVNAYLQRFEIAAFIGLFTQAPLLYTGLPFIAAACYGVGLLYFVVYHDRSPLLTECICHAPKKMPWLFLYNMSIAAESHAYIIISNLIFIFFVIIINNTLSLLTIDVIPLSNPLLYLVITMLAFLLFRNYNGAIAGWFIRKKYSLGFAFMALAVGFTVVLTILDISFKPLFSIFTNSNILKHNLTDKVFGILLQERFEILLLGWFFISMPRLGSMIGRLSYGFTIREAIALNLLATSLVWFILNAFVLEAWPKVYTLFIDPFWLFYSGLFIILVIWLNGCYIRDRASLVIGPMAVFPTTHMKRRSNVDFMRKNFLGASAMLGTAGFIGWRFGQYFVTFILIFLLPIYIYFTFVMLKHFIGKLAIIRHSQVPISVTN